MKRKVKQGEHISKVITRYPYQREYSQALDGLNYLPAMTLCSNFHWKRLHLTKCIEKAKIKKKINGPNFVIKLIFALHLKYVRYVWKRINTKEGGFLLCTFEFHLEKNVDLMRSLPINIKRQMRRLKDTWQWQDVPTSSRYKVTSWTKYWLWHLTMTRYSITKIENELAKVCEIIRLTVSIELS